MRIAIKSSNLSTDKMILFNFILLTLWVMWDLSSLTRTRTCVPEVEPQPLDTRQVPTTLFQELSFFIVLPPSAIMMTLWDWYYQFPHFRGGETEAWVHLETCTHCEPRLKKYKHVDARIFLLVQGSDGLPLTSILSRTLFENCKTPLSVIFKLWVLIP